MKRNGTKIIKGNTYYFEAFTNVGIYRLDEKQAVLIDSCDHKRMVRSLDRELEAMELEPSLIINTHCHNDHICGNRYFSEKYGCRLLSTKLEQAFIHKPELEIEFYSSGLMTDERNNPFLGMEPSEAELDVKCPDFEDVKGQEHIVTTLKNQMKVLQEYCNIHFEKGYTFLF